MCDAENVEFKFSRLRRHLNFGVNAVVTEMEKKLWKRDEHLLNKWLHIFVCECCILLNRPFRKWIQRNELLSH